MKILALDIATKTGWATDTASGVWDLKPLRGESIGMRVVRFKAKVREMIQTESVEMVAYELPAGMHKNAIIQQSKMIGVLEDLCHELEIEYTHYSASEIKKFATGKGNAGKPQMIAQAKRNWPNVEIIDDNQADALFILALAKREFK